MARGDTMPHKGSQLPAVFGLKSEGDQAALEQVCMGKSSLCHGAMSAQRICRWMCHVHVQTFKAVLWTPGRHGQDRQYILLPALSSESFVQRSTRPLGCPIMRSIIVSWSWQLRPDRQSRPRVTSMAQPKLHGAECVPCRCSLLERSARQPC